MGTKVITIRKHSVTVE